MKKSVKTLNSMADQAVSFSPGGEGALREGHSKLSGPLTDELTRSQKLPGLTDVKPETKTEPSSNRSGDTKGSGFAKSKGGKY